MKKSRIHIHGVIKKAAAILLAVFVTLTTLPSFAVSAEAANVWDGTVATGFAGGDGSQATPYLISNGEQLAYLAQQVNSGTTYSGKYFKQTADITLNDESFTFDPASGIVTVTDGTHTGYLGTGGYGTVYNTTTESTAGAWYTSAALTGTLTTGSYGGSLNSWTPIGNNCSFDGSFDGDGHTVSGININSSNTHSKNGLFGSSGGTLQNIGVVNSYVTAPGPVGGMIGEITAGGTVKNCYNTGIVSGTGYYVGGIAGGNDGTGTIENCYNAGTVIGLGYTGGVSGGNNGGTVKNCYNIGDVNATNGGGVVGSNLGGIVENCYNAGTVSGATGDGGIVGANNKSGDTVAMVENCYNAGTVSDNTNYNGGVVGFNNGCTVTGCYYDKQMCPVGGINSSDVAGQAEGKATADMTGTALSDSTNWTTSNWVFTDGLYPRLVNMDTTDAAYVSVSPVFLVSGDTAASVTKSFTMSTENSVGWASGDSSVVSVSGGSAALLKSGSVTMAASLGSVARTVALTIPTTATFSGGGSTSGVWDGTAATGFAGGDGSQATPYLISNGAQLAHLAQKVEGGETYKGKYFELTADIVLNDETFTFDPASGIVTVTDGTHTGYLGTGGYGTVYNTTTASTAGAWYTSDALTGTLTAGSYGGTLNAWTPIGNSDLYGFYGNFDGGGHTVSGEYINSSSENYYGLFSLSTGTIQNIGVVNSYVCGRAAIGSVLSINNGTVENCYSTGIVCGTYNVGGVAGSNTVTLENCYNTGAVIGLKGSDEVGGVMGYNCGTVENSNNTGTVCGTTGIGGVVGDTSGPGTVANSYNTGAVIGLSGSTYVGGVVGWAYGGTVTNCYNIGVISGASYDIGGVVGENNRGTIENSYSAGAVSGINGTSDIGGVAGDNLYGTVANCYNVGTVSHNCGSGGVVGNNSGQVTGCYYDKQMCQEGGISDSDVAGQAEGMATAEMTGSALSTANAGWTTSNWVFTDNLYPRLSGMDTTDAAYVSVSPVFLVSGDTVASVTKNFTMSTENGVGWASGDSSTVSVSGGSAALLKTGGVTMTASLGNVARTVTLTITNTAAPAFTSVSAAPGTNANKTAISIGDTLGAGDSLAVIVSSSQISPPKTGDPAPTGSTVTNPYSSGADISGVDATTNKYVGVYELDGNGHVVKFTQITLTDSQIGKQPPTAPTLTSTANSSSYNGGWTSNNVKIVASGSSVVSGIQYYEYSTNGGGTWTKMPDQSGAKDSTSGNAVADTLTISSDMNGDIHVRAVSNTGIKGDDSVVTVKRDSVSPSIHIDASGTTGQWTKDPVTFTLSNTANNTSPVTYWVKIGSADWTQMTGNTYIFSSSINEACQFKAVSDAGSEATSGAYAVMVDKAAPTGMAVKVHNNSFTGFLHTITFGLFFNSSTDITLTANDAESGISYYECQLVDTSKGQSFNANGTWTKSASGLFSVDPQFKGVIYARATDKAGNVTAASEVVQTDGFAVDNQKPAAPAATATVNGNTYNSGWTSGDVKIVASDPSALSGIQYYEYSTNGGSTWTKMPDQSGAKDSTSGNAVADTLTISSDMNGDIHVRAVSNSGIDSNDSVVTVKRDSVTPSVGVTVSGTTGQWTENPVTFTFSNTANNISPVTYWVKIGSGDWTQISGSTYTITGNVNTTYQFKAVSSTGDTVFTSEAYPVKLASDALEEVNKNIDNLPDPGNASDKQIMDNAQGIKDAKILYDKLSTDEQSGVGQPRIDKLNGLIDRLNAILVIIPKDTDTGITASNIGTSVQLPELNDPNVGKVEVKLVVDPITSSTQHGNIAVASDNLSNSGSSLVAAYDVSLIKSVFDAAGNQTSSGKISNSNITGPITIRIPVPVEYQGSNNLQVVYIDDNGNVTPLATTLVTVDGVQYLQFTTTHFSMYAVTAPNKKADSISNPDSIPNPKTGNTQDSLPDNIATLLSLAFISTSSAAIVHRKRRKAGCCRHL